MCETEAGINLRTLARIDATIQHIEASATQVAVYKYNKRSSGWEKIETEGSLFLVSRNSAPFNSIIVINRLNTTNMNEPITNDLDMNVQPPFLQYKNANSEVYCIWFFDAIECTQVADTLRKLSKSPSRSTLAVNGDIGLKLAQLGIKNMTVPDGLKNHSNVRTESNVISNRADVRNGLANIANKQRPIDVAAKAKKNGHAVPESAKQVTSQTSNPIQILTRPASQPPFPSGTSTSKGRSVDLQELFAKASTKNGIKNSQQPPTVVDRKPELIPSLHPSFAGAVGVSHHDDVVLTPEMISMQSVDHGSMTMVNGKAAVNGSPPAVIMNNQHAMLHRPTPTQGLIDSLVDPRFTAAAANHHVVAPLPQPSVVQRPISMEHLKQTLISLLQNDADFLHAIHTAYLNRFQQP